MMFTHQWVDQYKASTPDVGEMLAGVVADAVQFDFGDADDVPMAPTGELAQSRPPFDNCVLQFSTPNSKHFSHVLISWKGITADRTVVVAGWRYREPTEWRTTAPCVVDRIDGGFHYEKYGFQPEGYEAAQRAHAMALNAFYVLGCSNVKTVDHEGPAALNKKRARTGRFPILSHKTLVVVTDADKLARVDHGGTHSSPRLHLRRGHIRRLDDKRRVWVQPCVVGSKHGMVTKDYRVTQKNALGSNV